MAFEAVHGQRRRLARAAAAVAAALAADSAADNAIGPDAVAPAAADADTAALCATLQMARASLRRACNLGQADGGAARAPALLALARAATALGMPPSPLQLQAALGMHAAYAVEFGFVDGRPLAVALAAILHAWSGRHCHIVSAGEQLAARDLAALAPLYRLCGVTADLLLPNQAPAAAAACYGGDIVYATGRQLLSDFMRDALLLAGATSPLRRQLQGRSVAAVEQRPVTRPLGVALIDDIEAVLVDEAGSPVVISAAGNTSVLDEATVAAYSLVAGLAPGRDYAVLSQPGWQVVFTDAGEARLAALGMALPVYWQHPQRRYDLVSNALLARDTLVAERHYLVQEGRLMLADESVFRLLAGRVWHNGILQALEVRNGLPLSTPPRTVARAALQTYFPRYAQLAGIGSSLGALRQELRTGYGLPLWQLVRPARPAPLRQYHYLERAAKLDGFIALVAQLHGDGQPLLIAAPRTADLAAIARQLVERGLAFQAVDGRDAALDAASLAAAGTTGAITLVTAAAGRNGVPLPAPTLHALLFEHGDTRRADQGILAWAPFGVVFASLDDLLLRPLPAWAAPLRHLLARWPLASAGSSAIARLLLSLSQWQAARSASGYRRSLALRENQLDEQLAFSGKG